MMTAEVTVALAASGASSTHKGRSFIKAHCPSSSVVAFMVHTSMVPGKTKSISAEEVDHVIRWTRQLDLPAIMGVSQLMWQYQSVAQLNLGLTRGKPQECAAINA
eukprot:3071927-Amphidinium_carterae.1